MIPRFMPDRNLFSKPPPESGFKFYLHFPVVLAGSLACGICLQNKFSFSPVFLTLLFSVLIVPVIFFFRRVLYFNFFITASCVVLGAYLYSTDTTLLQYREANRMISEYQKQTEISGVLTDPSFSEKHRGQTRFSGKLKSMSVRDADSHELKSVPGMFYVSGVSEVKPAHGSQVLMKGDLSPPEKERNFFRDSQESRWMRRGISGRISNAQMTEIFPPEGRLFRIRNLIEQRIDSTLNEQSAQTVKALFLGLRTDFNYEDRLQIADSGLLHLFAISGFHIGILGGIILIVCTIFIRHKQIRYLLTLTALVAYGFMIGWRPSVLRAVVMFALLLISRMTYRKPDYLNITSLAAVFIMVIDPDQLFLPGFQLSFAAVYGLVLWLKRIVPVSKGRKRIFRRWIQMSGAASCVAWAATLPVVLYWFGQANAMAPVWNLLAAPAAVLITVLSTVYSVLLFILPKGFPVLPAVLESAVSGFYSLVDLISSFPFGVIFSPRPAMWLMAVYYLLLHLTLQVRHVLPLTRWCAIVSFSSFSLMCWSSASVLDKSDTVFFLDAGQADAALFRFADGSMLLVDTGKPYRPDTVSEGILPVMRHYGRKALDAAVISHPQFDHAGALSDLIRRVEIRHLVFSGDQSESDFWKQAFHQIESGNTGIHEVHYGNSLKGFGNADIRILHPPEYFSGSLNDRSVVLLLTVNGNRVLMTGDLGPKGIQEMMFDNPLSAVNVLKVPHHGADFKQAGRELIQSLSPDISVMSLGKDNRYGHPRAGTMEAVKEWSGSVYRTDLSGAIQINLQTLEVKTLTNQK